PKRLGGGVRLLGVSTVEDRIAQTAAATYPEPKVEPLFLEDSYQRQQRPGKGRGSPHEPIGQAPNGSGGRSRYSLTFSISVETTRPDRTEGRLRPRGRRR